VPYRFRSPCHDRNSPPTKTAHNDIVSRCRLLLDYCKNVVHWWMCGDIIVWLGVQQNNKLNVNVVLVYGPFLTYEWAVLDVAVGRFGPGYGPFLPFAWAVLVHGPLWYRPTWVSWFPPCFSFSVGLYPEHPFRTGQKSSYPPWYNLTKTSLDILSVCLVVSVSIISAVRIFKILNRIE